MSDYASSELTFEEMPASQVPPAAMAANDGAVVLGDRNDLHIGDYVGFERISPSKEWKLSLGKVIGFPSTRTVKVAHYDAVNDTSVAQDPVSEAAVQQRAEADDKMDIWHNREALREDLAQASAKEKAAAQRLFAARDETVIRQVAAGDRVTETLEVLDKARRDLRAIPSKQWRALRDPGTPSAEVVGVLRSVMLILYEDSVTEWEDIQEVMRRPDFMDRIVGWDCTVTPMSLARRKKIVSLCAGESEASLKAAKKRRRSGSRTPGLGAPTGPLTIEPKSSSAPGLVTLDKSIRAWINAQLACSEAAREQEIVINDCFADQQEQRVLLREINDMRVGISSLEHQILEMKNAILGIDDSPKPIMPLDAYQTDTVFYKRTYPDSEGRFVQEIILRDSVIINFGPMAEEDSDGYVRLNQTQADYLRTAVITSNVRHDAEEMEELLARKEREEQEMAELRARIQELRSKSSLTAEEEEELAQLEKLLADAERRHHATLSRIADLYACGRGAREITLAIKRPEFRYTRLHCKMSNDWSMILSDPVCYNEMLAAFCDDVSNLLNIPSTYVLDIDARAGSLLIDFTVKHNGDLDDDELQELINNGKFSALSMFYEKVTFKKTSPLNTSQQIEAYELEQRLAGPASISGMGIRQILADYYNPDGTLDEEFSDAVKADPRYRKAIITIPPLREDYDAALVSGPFEQYAGDDEEAPDAKLAASAMASTGGAEAEEAPAAAAAAAAIPEEPEEEEEAAAPPTELRARATTPPDAAHEAPAEAAAATAPTDEPDTAAAGAAAATQAKSTSSSTSSGTSTKATTPRAELEAEAEAAAEAEKTERLENADAAADAAAAAEPPVDAESIGVAAASAAPVGSGHAKPAAEETAVCASTKALSAVTSPKASSKASSKKSSKKPSPKEKFADEL